LRLGGLVTREEGVTRERDRHVSAAAILSFPKLIFPQTIVAYSENGGIAIQIVDLFGSASSNAMVLKDWNEHAAIEMVHAKDVELLRRV